MQRRKNVFYLCNRGLSWAGVIFSVFLNSGYGDVGEVQEKDKSETNENSMTSITSKWTRAKAEKVSDDLEASDTNDLTYSWPDVSKNTKANNKSISVPPSYFIGASSTPTGMVLINAGPFKMGAGYINTYFSNAPVHTVLVSAVYMDWEWNNGGNI